MARTFPTKSLILASRYNKIKKINHIKAVKNIHILRNIITKNYWQSFTKIVISNQVTYRYFVSNEFINFSESIWMFKMFLNVFEKKKK